MTTLIEIDDDLAAGLQQLAADRQTELKALVGAELDASLKREEGRKRLRHLVETAPLQLEPGWKWNREDCYDRPLLRGYKRPPLRSDGTP